MKKLIIALLSGAVAFIAVRYGFQSQREVTALQQVDTEMAAIRQAARENYPDQPEVLAVQQAAVDKVAADIYAKPTERERLQTAAGAFLGFYLVNQRERADYCDDLGVDITPFVAAFEAAHAQEHRIAIDLLAANEMEVDKLYTMLKPQLATVIEQDMNFIASEHQISLAQACQLVSDTALELVPQIHVSVLQPAVFETLHSAVR